VVPAAPIEMWPSDMGRVRWVLKTKLRFLIAFTVEALGLELLSGPRLGGFSWGHVFEGILEDDLGNFFCMFR
jgi:hypothetical protein